MLPLLNLNCVTTKRSCLTLIILFLSVFIIKAYTVSNHEEIINEISSGLSVHKESLLFAQLAADGPDTICMCLGLVNEEIWVRAQFFEQWRHAMGTRSNEDLVNVMYTYAKSLHLNSYTDARIFKGIHLKFFYRGLILYMLQDSTCRSHAFRDSSNQIIAFQDFMQQVPFAHEHENCNRQLAVSLSRKYLIDSEKAISFADQMNVIDNLFKVNFCPIECTKKCRTITTVENTNLGFLKTIGNFLATRLIKCHEATTQRIVPVANPQSNSFNHGILLPNSGEYQCYDNCLSFGDEPIKNDIFDSENKSGLKNNNRKKFNIKDFDILNNSFLKERSLKMAEFAKDLMDAELELQQQEGKSILQENIKTLSIRKTKIINDEALLEFSILDLVNLFGGSIISLLGGKIVCPKSKDLVPDFEQLYPDIVNVESSPCFNSKTPSPTQSNTPSPTPNKPSRTPSPTPENTLSTPSPTVAITPSPTSSITPSPTPLRDSCKMITGGFGVCIDGDDCDKPKCVMFGDNVPKKFKKLSGSSSEANCEVSTKCGDFQNIMCCRNV